MRPSQYAIVCPSLVYVVSSALGGRSNLSSSMSAHPQHSLHPHKSVKPSAGLPDQDASVAPWQALFYFTARSHISCLVVAVASALASGGASPAQSLLTGKAFEAFASSSSTSDLLRKESRYALYLIAIAAGSWLLHFVFFAAWVTFGELQANSARDRLFAGLLKRDIAWFDMRKNGGGALISRLQMLVATITELGWEADYE